VKYADLTINDPNPVKRWVQRRRFADAVGVLRGRPDAGPIRVLDFGAGDGELVRRIADGERLEAWVYEPVPELLAQAREKLAGLPGVSFASDVAALEPGSFDYVFCLEVFEHLPETETVAALTAIHRLLKPGGSAVIGVPHELFLPALLKGLFRITRRYGDFDASFRNVFAAALGRVPVPRPLEELAPGVSYHFHHLGFDYRVLERQLAERFRIVQRWFSPVPILSAALNSEVYFVLRKDAPDA
jgi:SAM-dependent methyltransferase